jgi:hypothetical protein
MEIFAKYNRDFEGRTRTALWQNNLGVDSRLWMYNKFSGVTKIITLWAIACSTENT